MLEHQVHKLNKFITKLKNQENKRTAPLASISGYTHLTKLYTQLTLENHHSYLA